MKKKSAFKKEQKISYLTHAFSMRPFSNPGKHRKNEVF